HVLLFGGNEYTLGNIQNGSFSISTPAGGAVVLAFLDSAYNYIGNLFCGGLNVLPLVGLSDGINTQIDLGDLSLNEYAVIPAHDPFGNEIILGNKETAFLQQLGRYYASIAANIDSDHDSIPDILSEKHILLSGQFFLRSGFYGTDLRSALVFNNTAADLRYSLRAEGGRNISPEQEDILLSGPREDPYAQITTWHQLYLDGGDFIACFKIEIPNDTHMFAGTSSPAPFKMGTYLLSVGNQPGRSLEYSNEGVLPYLIIPVPTIHTNNEGNLSSVSLTYRFPDGTEADPGLLFNDLSLQFDGSNGDQEEGGRMFTIGNLFDESMRDIDFYEISVSPPRDISGLLRVSTCCTDLLGNSYEFTWFKEIGS
ncbi:MAG: hypothetical protein WCY99_04955, partial [Candidatus Neomarinimicrobiota bacterium]